MAVIWSYVWSKCVAHLYLGLSSGQEIIQVSTPDNTHSGYWKLNVHGGEGDGLMPKE